MLTRTTRLSTRTVCVIKHVVATTEMGQAGSVGGVYTKNQRAGIRSEGHTLSLNDDLKVPATGHRPFNRYLPPTPCDENNHTYKTYVTQFYVNIFYFRTVVQ